jgi:hypothetical protein
MVLAEGEIYLPVLFVLKVDLDTIITIALVKAGCGIQVGYFVPADGIHRAADIHVANLLNA